MLNSSLTQFVARREENGAGSQRGFMPRIRLRQRKVGDVHTDSAGGGASPWCLSSHSNTWNIKLRRVDPGNIGDGFVDSSCNICNRYE
jgi:hypothetical protein